MKRGISQDAKVVAATPTGLDGSFGVSMDKHKSDFDRLIEDYKLIRVKLLDIKSRIPDSEPELREAREIRVNDALVKFDLEVIALYEAAGRTEEEARRMIESIGTLQ